LTATWTPQVREQEQEQEQEQEPEQEQEQEQEPEPEPLSRYMSPRTKSQSPGCNLQ